MPATRLTSWSFFSRSLITFTVLTGISTQVTADAFFPRGSEETVPQGEEESIPPLVRFSAFFLGETGDGPMNHTTYSMAATNMPIADVLNALGQKAGLSVDLPEKVQGTVTLTISRATLPNLLERIGKAANIHCDIKDNVLLVQQKGLFIALNKPPSVSPAGIGE